jgi:hypothetical protein
MIMNSVGGRKFFLVSYIFVVLTVLLYFSKIESASFLSIVQMLIISYPAGNLAQSFLIKKLPEITGDELKDLQQSTVLGGRKFGLIVVIFSTVTGLLIFKKMEIEHFVTLTNWLIGIYIAGNVAEKAIDQGINVEIKTNK